MATIPSQNSLYGFTSPISGQFPAPIISLRAPGTSDFAPLGQLWVDKPAATIYILASVVANVATWLELIASGGPGSFTSLTVNPGPINFTGTFTQLGNVNMNTSGAFNTNIGSGTNTGTITIGNTAGAQATHILAGTGNMFIDGAVSTNIDIGNSLTTGAILVGSSQTTGTLSLGGAAQTGAITLGNSSGAQTLNLGVGSGVSTVDIATGTAGNTVNVATGANGTAQIINLASGASGANSTVNLLSGNATAGTQQLNVLTGNRAGVADIGTGAAAHQINIGSSTAGNQTTINSPVLALPGPVFIYTGAGAPNNGLALHVGDLYINTTAATATTRLYIATAAGAWTFFTANS